MVHDSSHEQLFFQSYLFLARLNFFSKNTSRSDYIIRIRLLGIFELYNSKFSFTIILIRLWFIWMVAFHQRFGRLCV